jgi:hypothetical protein
MKRTQYLFSSTLVMTLFATSSAFACSVIPRTKLDVYLSNKPAKQAKDCSVKNIGEGDWAQGNASEDLGSGRVFQYFTNDVGVLTDCNEAKQIALLGIEVPEKETSCGEVYDLKAHLAPNGSIDLTVGSSIQEAEMILAKLHVVTRQYMGPANASSFSVMKPMKRDEFDLFCGCKVYYPSSVGAKL